QQVGLSGGLVKAGMCVNPRVGAPARLRKSGPLDIQAGAGLRRRTDFNPFAVHGPHGRRPRQQHIFSAMARIVMKFGGTSVADIARIRTVANHVKREVESGHEVAVVVSAMAGKTNELVALAREMPRAAGASSPFFDAREYDTIVASGEQVTSGLLAIALQSIGIDARSWQGWQIPIRTDKAHGAARILEIDGSEIVRR